MTITEIQNLLTLRALTTYVTDTAAISCYSLDYWSVHSHCQNWMHLKKWHGIYTTIPTQKYNHRTLSYWHTKTQVQVKVEEAVVSSYSQMSTHGNKETWKTRKYDTTERTSWLSCIKSQWKENQWSVRKKIQNNNHEETKIKENTDKEFNEIKKTIHNMNEKVNKK